MDPTPEDWLAVGNDIRKVLGLPLYDGCGNRIPLEEELDEWERVCTGAKNQLKKMARKEMEHRLVLEKIKKTKAILIFLIIVIIIGLLTLSFGLD